MDTTGAAVNHLPEVVGEIVGICEDLWRRTEGHFVVWVNDHDGCFTIKAMVLMSTSTRSHGIMWDYTEDHYRRWPFLFLVNCRQRLRALHTEVLNDACRAESAQ